MTRCHIPCPQPSDPRQSRASRSAAPPAIPRTATQAAPPGVALLLSKTHPHPFPAPRRDATRCHAACYKRPGGRASAPLQVECRLRRHLVAVPVPHFLREERSGNTAPQLLSIGAPLHSELSGRLRRSKPGTQSATALPVSLPANPARRRGNSLLHSARVAPLQAVFGRDGLT